MTKLKHCSALLYCTHRLHIICSFIWAISLKQFQVHCFQNVNCFIEEMVAGFNIVMSLDFLIVFLSSALPVAFSPRLPVSALTTSTLCVFYVCAWEALSDRLVVNVFSQGIRLLLMKYRCCSHGQINRSTNRDERTNRTHILYMYTKKVTL